MKIPCKEKFIDEAVGIYIIFGRYSDGSVDVHSEGLTNSGDVFTGLNKDIAEKVVDLQREFREKLYKLMALP